MCVLSAEGHAYERRNVVFADWRVSSCKAGERGKSYAMAKRISDANYRGQYVFGR